MLPLCYAVPNGLNSLFLKLHLRSQIIGFFTPMISDPRKLRAASGSLGQQWQPWAASGSLRQPQAAMAAGNQMFRFNNQKLFSRFKRIFCQSQIKRKKTFSNIFWKILKKVDDRRFIQMIRRLNPAKIF